ncbi:uncharacterized protein LOC126378341 isoform X2 [Pectinophora gossypiella]|uniref:uncharacterized protein LOC126378341 isoform X2 n=1 Tax=Pectinophora gossypiella TaxID=13191 RepID=UPI00214F5F24|nr:uncharacterized protein LOC126378341 isoform X2 [Pectinophora gossypiella]
MEKSDPEKSSGSEETTQLNRNRSFKSKQLVRSQAIRESTSPPRTVSPSVVIDRDPADPGPSDPVDPTDSGDHADPRSDNVSSHGSDDISSGVNAEYSDDCKKQPVEIQITGGAWEDSRPERRTRRWASSRSSHLLSNNPRVSCVCGACHACPHCRGRRRRQACPTKQDSGIVCSDDCPDCSDTEPNGGTNAEGGRTSSSLDADETFYCRCPERKEKPKSISLSRTDSDEKSEPTGPELISFIRHTLNKNPRDRMTLLKIEKELHALVLDTGRCIVRFPVMTSYGRMLVHRCAALFQLSHHLDQNNKTSVLVSKSGTCGGRIPCTSFKQWCTMSFPPSPQRHDVTHAKSILKRDTHSLDEPGGGSLSAARSKSLEQREREYERVRRRIFSSDNCNQDESQWQWLNSGQIKLLTPEGGRNRLLKVQSLEGAGPSSGSGQRGPVSKSHSFGGYGRPQPDPPRLLSRQGDLASSSWRLSPSSSGYRTLSLHSTDSVTPSPTGGASPEPANPEGVAVVWAVTDLSAVPAGALVIHPQTGRPLTNPDGSVYHFDPNNPPILNDANVYMPDQKTETNCEKKRGRLEKQHSFIDNDCECQPSEETRSKCCCECRRHDSCSRNNTEKNTTNSEQKPHQNPTSPCKNRYEQPVEASSNHNAPPEPPTNHRPTYEAATNQKPAPENPANQRQAYDVTNQNYNPATNIRPAYDVRHEVANQRAFENRPQSFEASQKFEPTNQRAPNDVANHRQAKLSNQGTPELQYVTQQYPQVFSHEEVTSSPQAGPPYMQQELAQQLPIKQMVQDPNMRVIYPGVAQYQFSSPLPVYQPAEEPKHDPHAPTTIEPNYGYAALEYAPAAACAGCVEPRVYPALYAPVDPLVQYPLHHHYPYQEQLQWPNMQGVVPLQAPHAQQTVPKLFVPELYPVMQYPVYPQYNVMYPQQVVPPAYPACSAPCSDRRAAAPPRHSKRNSISGSSRNTPLLTPPDDKKVPYEDHSQQPHPQHPQSHPQTPQVTRQDSNDIAVKIQQIKDQMAQLNTREREKYPRREEWRRNSGNGILGSYPANNYNGRVMGPRNDESQLSTAARAIVNSIRSMQAKNHYPDRRPEYSQPRCEAGRGPRARPDKPERGDRPVSVPYHTNYLLRQMSPGTWCRRSPGPVHPLLNNPRRPHPDTRNGRR